ncbi:periplasmic heavy metal sensor [Paraburkholderia lycopersici]|uniref:Protein refolding chaperone Spy/CpxP family n=1 Tax=Paraburkholderia lycopersici TaxID=416944 RepID=A0A1G6NVQ4_9BURK|nr:periplasmic heavy metal sensor [Paraburkholderia lycopersici]SDC71337.1 protein refolding chaperone Spy/CpxP family [Paraburkholderia lycopersici]
MYKTTSRLLAIAAASLALTVGAAAANAQTPPPGGPGMMHGGPGMMHGGPGMHGDFMLGFKKLHDKLNLNAAQEKQWQAALDTMKQNGAAMRKNHEQLKQQFDAMKNQPILDLNAMHAAHQQIDQQNQQLREQTAQAWLAFYNGLNDQQKTTVSATLKDRFAKMEQRHEKMRERWEQHRGQHQGGASAPAAQQ